MRKIMLKKYNLMVASCFLVVFLAFICADFYMTWSDYSIRLQKDAQNTAIYAEGKVNEIRNFLQVISKAPVLKSNDRQKISLYLQEMGELPQVSAIEVANKKGERWAGTNKSVSLVDVRDREHFIKTIATSRPYVTNAVKSKLFGHIEFLVTYPIYTNQPNFENYLFAPVRSEDFKAFISKIKPESQGALHIIDEQGNLLINNSENISALKAYQPLVEKNGSPSFLNDLLNISGSVVFVSQPINGTPWTVIVDRNAKTVFGLVSQKIFYDCLFILIAILPILLAFFILLNKINKQKQDLVRSNKKLQNLAVTDGLTGLLNHRAFQDTLSQCLIEAGEHAPLTLLLIDIDNFKIFNDHYGHLVGDKVLKMLSRIMRSYFNNRGYVARYGGEEFVVILPETGCEKGYTLAKDLSERISSTPLQVDDSQETRINVSIGIASYPKDATDRENLIRFADRALYKAKEQESNKVQLYYSVLEELRENISCDQDLMKIIHTLNTIINAKDKYTYGHSERVMEYASKLAKYMRLNKKDVDHITIGAFLHDIGKIEVSGDILNKPEKLTIEEFEIIRKHPIIGSEIIHPLKSLGKAIDFAMYHHEKYDGTGYPFGLKGQDIPLYGRIAAIVDSFDAMTTNRPYQKARTKNEALEELKRCAGSHYDPEIVAIFIEMYENLPDHDKKEEVDNQEPA